MLYRQICFVGLSIYATLSRTVFGATYYEYAWSLQTLGSCANATASDRCIFHCDAYDGLSLNFDCHNAGICDVYCEEKKCLLGGEINATNVQQFNLYPTAAYCLKDGTVYLPSHGSANISVTSDVYSPLEYATINAGTNTSEIYIHCLPQAACEFMHINAQTAQLLYIKDSNDGNIVNCPASYGTECIIDVSNTGLQRISAMTINANKTSLYINASGGRIDSSTINVNNAPCYINIANSGVLSKTSLYISNTLCTINATNGGSTISAEIYTVNGYPHDVVFENIVERDVSAILYCSGIDTKIQEVRDSAIFDQINNECFNSRTPTVDSTKSPSSSPTFHPSQAPSHTIAAPTFHPSMNTLDPSLTPTVNPSLDPTDSPSFVPSVTPTKVEIHVNITKNPSQPTSYYDISSTEHIDDTQAETVDLAILLWIGPIIVVLLLLLLACCFAVLYFYKYRRANAQLHEANMNKPQKKAAQSSIAVVATSSEVTRHQRERTISSSSSSSASNKSNSEDLYDDKLKIDTQTKGEIEEGNLEQVTIEGAGGELAEGDELADGDELAECDMNNNSNNDDGAHQCKDTTINVKQVLQGSIVFTAVRT